MKPRRRTQIESGFTRRAMTFVLLAVTGIVAAIMALHFRGAAQTARAEKRGTESPSRSPSSAVHRDEAEPPGRIVQAAWYDVPRESLARRRAGDEPLTAAHNSLPLGTRLRVTHLANGRSVTVRVTDRGITDHRIQLDVCKEAAEELEMVGQGIAKVRMEVLSDE